METKTIILLVAIGVAVILVLWLIGWILSKRRIVPTTEVHIVRGSRSTNAYGSTEPVHNAATGKTVEYDKSAGNVYYEIPIWVPFFGVDVRILNLANFDIDLKDYEAYDKNKLPFNVDITAFFRIANYKLAATRIDCEATLKKQLDKVVKGAARTVLAKDELEDIMVKRTEYSDDFTKEVAKDLEEWGLIPIKSVELMDLKDVPEGHVISDIMNKRKSFIERESRIEVAKNKQLATEAEIAAKQSIEIKQEEMNETIGQRQAARKQAVGIADENAKQKIQDQAKITKQKEMAVLEVETIQKAEIDKNKMIVEANGRQESQKIDAQTQVIVADEKNKAAIHEANANFTKETKASEAELINQENIAKAIAAKGKAEAEAKEQLGLAEVQPQITLAKEIGENKGYQSYLIEIKKVEATQAVGIEQAKNLGNAQIKIIANAGNNVETGVKSVMDLFNASGGQALGSMLEAFKGTEAGQQIIEKLTGTKDEK